MATDKAALGRKYTCFSCGCKFYDLNREPATCPRCEADQADDPNPPMDPALLFRQPRGSRKKKAEAKAAEAKAAAAKKEAAEAKAKAEGAEKPAEETA